MKKNSEFKASSQGRASERVTFEHIPLRSGNYESSSFNSHSFVHAVIAAQPLQSDMQLFFFSTYQNAKSAANREIKM